MSRPRPTGGTSGGSNFKRLHLQFGGGNKPSSGTILAYHCPDAHIRWSLGHGSRGGMQVLGKVRRPKPVALPSLRAENQGLDPNVKIVPKGGAGWGAKKPEDEPEAAAQVC